MRIRVELTGPLRVAAAVGSQDVEAPNGATVHAVLAQLAGELGRAGESALLRPTGGLAAGIVVCVNDAQVTDVVATRLNPGDEILLISAISGG